MPRKKLFIILYDILKKISLLFSLLIFIFFVKCSSDISYDKSIEVESLIDSTRKYRFIDIDKSLSFSREAVSISSEHNLKRQTAATYKEIGTIWLNAGNNDSAKYYYEKSIKLCKEAGDHETRAKNLHNIGNLYDYKYEYNKAFDYYEKAINVRDSFDIQQSEITYNNMGVVYQSLELFEKANDAFFESLKISEKNKNKIEIATACTNIGYCFLNMVKNDKDTSHSNLAVKYFQKSLDIYNTFNDSNNVALVLINIGDLYRKIKAKDQALQYTQKAEKLLTKLGDKDNLSIVFLNNGLIQKDIIGNDTLALQYFSKALMNTEKSLFQVKIESEVYERTGEIYIKKNELTKAKKYFIMALNIADSVNDTERQQSVYKNLSKLYEKSGQFETAYKTLNKSRILYDSIFTEQNNKTIISAPYKYDFKKEKQEKENLKKINAVQKQKNNIQQILIISIVIAVIFLLIIFFVIYRLNKIKQFNIHQLLEIKSLRTQMNPHLIGNTLSALQDIILDKRTIDAVRFVAMFSKLMRQLTQNARKNTITLESEIKFINLFVAIQKIRWKTEFVFINKIEPDIDTEIVKIPPMLIQPYNENAIEHGLIHKKEKRKLILSIYEDKKPDYIIIDIIDNGIGLKRSSELNKNRKNHVSTSIININERISLFNKMYKTKWLVKISAPKKGGTKISIRVSNL